MKTLPLRFLTAAVFEQLLTYPGADGAAEEGGEEKEEGGGGGGEREKLKNFSPPPCGGEIREKPDSLVECRSICESEASLHPAFAGKDLHRRELNPGLPRDRRKY